MRPRMKTGVPQPVEKPENDVAPIMGSLSVPHGSMTPSTVAPPQIAVIRISCLRSIDPPFLGGIVRAPIAEGNDDPRAGQGTVPLVGGVCTEGYAAPGGK